MTSSTAQTVNCTATGKSWDEVSFHDMEGAGKLSRASIVNALAGEIEGEGVLVYLMSYPASAGADVPFIGYERIIGRIGARSGSFTVQHDGVYSATSGVHATLRVAAGSGTGGFAGVSGSGTAEVKAGEMVGVYTLALEYGA